MSIAARRATREQQLANHNSGVNLGAWRLRDFTTWTKDSNELTHVQTWLQRDIHALRAQVYAGETYTSAQVFDSVGLRGIALKTDDNMLPASLSGYAPEVRGIARSNATVTVAERQHHLSNLRPAGGVCAERSPARPPREAIWRSPFRRTTAAKRNTRSPLPAYRTWCVTDR